MMNQAQSHAVQSRMPLICLLLVGASLSLNAQWATPLIEDETQTEIAGVHEDLLHLSIQGSNLQAMPLVPGGTTETADFTRELYQMQWRDADPVDVYVILPKGVRKPPVAVYIYGYPADANRFRNDAFCKLATRGGVAAIGFMPALTGQRYHDVPMRTWFVSDLHDSIVKTVHDLQMVIDYAASRDDLDGQRVGVFGQGAGATIAGLAAMVDPRIQAIDLLDPWGDWPEWVAKSRLIPDDERGAFLKPEYLDSLAPLDPIHWLPSLQGKPLKLDEALFEQGTPSAAKALIEAAMPASGQLVRYATQADFDKKAIADGQLLIWMQQQLLLKPTHPLDEVLVAPAAMPSATQAQTQVQGSN